MRKFTGQKSRVHCVHSISSLFHVVLAFDCLASSSLLLCYSAGPCLHFNLPVVPARGGAEVALKIYIRPFSSIELACAVRQPSPCVRALCESGVPFHMSHLKLHFALHTSHCTLHTPHCTLHSSRPTLHTALFTLHTSSHLSSSHLIPAHLFSSHLFSYVI